MQQYISEQGREVYDKEYNNYYKDLQYQDQLKQQAWENAFKEKQRQDQLAQQKWERQMAEKEYQLNARKVEASIAQANASIAAAKAANTKPLTPTGSNCATHG